MSKAVSTLIDGCTTEQLKELLELAARGSENDHVLLESVASMSEVHRLLTEMCGKKFESGDLLLNSVAAQDTSVEVLRGIKEFAKQLVSTTKSAPHRNAATLLYHAAEAAAYAHHGVNISTRSLETRWPLYQDLATALGDDPIGVVFRQAVDRGSKSPTR
jgi:hypothetical protein